MEFNKAAQTLIDAMVPNAHRTSALNRLLKVSRLNILVIFVFEFSCPCKLIYINILGQCCTDFNSGSEVY